VTGDAAGYGTGNKRIIRIMILLFFSRKALGQKMDFWLFFGIGTIGITKQLGTTLGREKRAGSGEQEKGI
jgi:hypothetical protein